MTNQVDIRILNPYGARLSPAYEHSSVWLSAAEILPAIEIPGL